MSEIIVTRALSKRYDHATQLALRELTMVVGQEVYGFLGANGAGKSTTIRTLLNFIQPTAGSATILGYDSVSDSVRLKRHIGYLAGEVALYSNMTGKQFLAYMTQLQPPKQKAYVQELVKRFALDTQQPIGTLSKGNRQKLGIIQAFMHQPEVLILDEPTSGLDPLMQEVFYALVRESRQQGATIFVSSHNFAEVQRMCDRVGFIREGQLVAEQTLAELYDQATHTFVVSFRQKAPVSQLRNITGSVITVRDQHTVVISLHGELTPLFALLAQFPVVHFEQQEVNLEQQFLHFYQHEKEVQ